MKKELWSASIDFDFSKVEESWVLCAIGEKKKRKEKKWFTEISTNNFEINIFF